jgi:hypothetical protein
MTVLQYLRRHPGTPQDELPDVLTWAAGRKNFAHSAWDAAQTSGVLALMPPAEVLKDQGRYQAFAEIVSQGDVSYRALHEASRFLFDDPDLSHLTPAQIATEIPSPSSG